MSASRKSERLAVMRSDAPIAASPGTLVVPEGCGSSTVTVMAYGPDAVVEEECRDLEGLDALSAAYPVVWVNVVGLGTLDTLTALGERFGLHRLALEDVLHVTQRPKVDEYGDHLFLTARMPVSRSELETEQLSVFLGQTFVLTFQEEAGDCFEGVRQRVRDGRPRLRRGGPGYLVYCLLDELVDAYFPLLESIGVSLEDLEDEVRTAPSRNHVHEIHRVKSELVTLRRYVVPLRDMVAALLRQDAEFFSEETRVYLRDCLDHAIRAQELIDSDRDLAAGLLELDLTLAGQRVNEVMKVLTITATVFIPLSFIAGLYGMNFDREASRWNLPELGWSLGYPFALGLMVLTAAGMLAFFWRRGWFR